MNTLTIVWITLPFFLGFTLFLFPKLDRYLACTIGLFSITYAATLLISNSSITLELLDSFGVTLVADKLSAFLILTNGLVTTAVILYCWQSGKVYFFYAQVIILHGSVNSTFICKDFISLYVALEVLSIASFLLITYPRTRRSMWVGLRYLFVSNTAMLFYLVGAVLVYQHNLSFKFDGLVNAPPEAAALIFLGLLVKGGVFVSGLWLPLTHSESESPVSALLSGVVIKASILPLVRCAVVLPELDPLIRLFGVLTALLGVVYAIFEQDTKRMLAFSTISQIGFILAAPEVGGFYALTHGLVKSSLFLIAGNLPSRNFKELKQTPLDNRIWIVLVIASFSISGFPLLAGFGAKVLTMKSLLDWQEIGMNIAALGTATAFAKFIFLPKGGKKTTLKIGFWLAMIILLGGLIIANGVYYDAYTLENTIKPLATIILGWLAYLFIFQKITLYLPRFLEKMEHLIGVMSLTLVVLFWMVLTWPSILFFD
ncbi:MAG: cation:proton antiporter [Microcystaceae cyanobacterium]